MKLTIPLRATLSAAWKDLQVIFKDRGLLVVIIVLPSVFSMLFGVVNQRVSSSGTEGTLFPVIVSNQDEGGFGQQIVDILEDVTILKITYLDAIAEAEQQVRESKALAAIILPPGLTQNVNAYQPSEIQVIIDPTQQQFAGLITGIMKEVIAPVELQGELSYGIRTLLVENPDYQQANEQTKRAYEAQSLAVEMAQVQEMRSDPWVEVEAQTQQGEELVIIPANVFALVVPSFVVLFAFFIVGSMAEELLKEKREGSLRRLIAAPIPRWAIIAGKMLAFLVLVVAQVALIFAGANLFFGMPVGESLSGLLLITVAMGIAATGLGMLVAAVSRTERQADSTGLILGFVLGGLGGCFVIGAPIPLYKGGGILETISKLTPQAHSLMGYDLLLNQGAGLVEVLPQALILFGFAAVFFLIASWRFRFE